MGFPTIRAKFAFNPRCVKPRHVQVSDLRSRASDIMNLLAATVFKRPDLQSKGWGTQVFATWIKSKRRCHVLSSILITHNPWRSAFHPPSPFNGQLLEQHLLCTFSSLPSKNSSTSNLYVTSISAQLFYNTTTHDDHLLGISTSLQLENLPYLHLLVVS